jgi:hypothetical protein
MRSPHRRLYPLDMILWDSGPLIVRPDPGEFAGSWSPGVGDGVLLAGRERNEWEGGNKRNKNFNHEYKSGS